MATPKTGGYSSLKNNLESDGVAEERQTLLNDESDEDEEAIFNNPSSKSRSETAQVHGKLESVKIEIRNVTDVMLDNVQKVMARGERLDDLELASDRLNIAGAEFNYSARKARRSAWLQHFFSKYAIYTVVLSILLIVLVTTIVKYS